jgi:hypothetical protein
MTTETSAGGTPAPAAPVTPAAVPPAAAPSAPAGDPTAEPSWLKERLTREREKGARDALSSAGFASEADAKAAATAAKAAADANKSAETRAAELAANVTTEKARADGLLAIAADHAARVLGALTPDQQAAVKRIAGDDPAQQLKTVDALAPTWAAAPIAAPVAAPVAKPPLPPPASTSAAGGAPAPATGAAPNHKAVLAELEKTNPIAAASYALRYEREIYDGAGA